MQTSSELHYASHFFLIATILMLLKNTLLMD